MTWYLPGWLEAMLDRETARIERERLDTLEDAVCRAAARGIGVSVYDATADGGPFSCTPDPLVPHGIIFTRTVAKGFDLCADTIESEPHAGPAGHGSTDYGSV